MDGLALVVALGAVARKIFLLPKDDGAGKQENNGREHKHLFERGQAVVSIDEWLPAAIAVEHADQTPSCDAKA